MSFSDYRFNVGVHVDSNILGEKPASLAIPESLGRFVTEIKQREAFEDVLATYPAVNCSDAFVLDVEPNNEMTQYTIPNGYCADPKNTVLNGSQLSKIYNKVALFKF